jgi:RimJ/RimL family protein N-acetyltransferase
VGEIIAPSDKRSMPAPAYRIHTSRLVLRCWNPADAPLLTAAITASLEHLRPWMPWAHFEPESVEAKAQRLRGFRADFDSDRNFIYGIFDAEETEVLGGTGLHPRVGVGAREIGYWIHADHVGRGYATEAAAALTRVAFEVDRVRRVEIHCDPKNEPSAAIPKRLGYRYDATLRQRQQTSEGEPRDTMIWSLLRDEYPESEAAGSPIRAFDVLGQRLL